jgi:hypothetical protein
MNNNLVRDNNDHPKKNNNLVMENNDHPKNKRVVDASLIDHSYSDFSYVQFDIGPLGRKRQAFPEKLHAILSNHPEYQHIICWQVSERSRYPTPVVTFFIVPNAFVNSWSSSSSAEPRKRLES